MGYYVYIHTCKANGKKYVGVTGRNPESRWKEGRGYKTNKHFYSAILKYGWDNFEHEVFEVDSKEEMYRKEVELISFYHSNDPEYGYNNSSGGEYSHLGCKHSEETRKKMAESHKGKPVSEETKKKISEIVKKRNSDPEYRKRMSETMKGRVFSKERREHLAESSRRKAKDPEFRKKLSEACKKRCSDPEVRKKMSEANLKRWSDPEYKKRVSEANKKSHSDPEYRRKMSEVQKKAHSDPEYRKRISETLKGRPKPKVKIKLPDGTIREMSKQALTRHYINKGRKFEYVS